MTKSSTVETARWVTNESLTSKFALYSTLKRSWNYILRRLDPPLIISSRVMVPISFLISDGASVERVSSDNVVVTTIHLQSSRSPIKTRGNSREKKLRTLSTQRIS